MPQAERKRLEPRLLGRGTAEAEAAAGPCAHPKVQALLADPSAPNHRPARCTNHPRTPGLADARGDDARQAPNEDRNQGFRVAARPDQAEEWG